MLCNKLVMHLHFPGSHMDVVYHCRGRKKLETLITGTRVRQTLCLVVV